MDTGDVPRFRMAPEDFVENLYRTCLGRPVDPSGLMTWTELIRSTGDPTLVLKGILESAEYMARAAAGSLPDCSAELERALALLDRRLRVVDVGAQSLGIGSHPYQPLLEFCEVEIIGFDPLEERLRERADAESAPGLKLLPYALGDGGTHTLYINNEDSTSSLFPVNEFHNARFHYLNKLHTVRTEQITTRRLDDVLPQGPADFLKLDVQGAELMVLEGAQRILERTAVIHCEVEFSPIYRGQPLFASVQSYLTLHGFTLIDLLVSCRYPYVAPSGRTAQGRLLWADAVFFRESDDSETQIVQALIAASVYRKPTLAEHLLVLAQQGLPLSRFTAP